jgi:hypothetical protein
LDSIVYGHADIGERSQPKKPTQKNEIILFFMIFEGICGLQVGESWMSTLWTRETRGYAHKDFFLNSFGEATWENV